mmetsp:Transcript_38951/g.59218  ORF Transcript_38951/g.59218 Transcript_38951/m.59218 type:complete len:232 (-) Transcript_38951:454-1149(-)
MKKVKGETAPERIIRVPFVLIFFFTNFMVLSALAHKEMRFITSLIQIGQIAQAYMITWCFDTRDVVLKYLQINTKASKKSIGWVKWGISWGIKSFALFVVIKQEQGRLVRWIFNNHYKYDSGLDAYNMFSGRSEKVSEEQPESVYFLDKFIQPTHLFMHSNPKDYPKTAEKKGITSNKDWDQTVVVYEAFRAPKFVPQHLREKFEQGEFNAYHERSKFNGTDEEYEAHLPG